MAKGKLKQKSKWRGRINKDTLNLVIAVCAVLISAASFYATFLQAQSEEKQVKASTWPYLQFSNGNFNPETNEAEIFLKVNNVGVGPAMLKNFTMEYQGIKSQNIYDILLDCCAPEGNDRSWFAETGAREKVGFIVTDVINNRILPADGELLVMSLKRTDNNGAFWDIFNDVRWQIKGEACYCSLLDDCYQTDFVSDPNPVQTCKRLN